MNLRVEYKHIVALSLVSYKVKLAVLKLIDKVVVFTTDIVCPSLTHKVKYEGTAVIMLMVTVGCTKVCGEVGLHFFEVVAVTDRYDFCTSGEEKRVEVVKQAVYTVKLYRLKVIVHNIIEATTLTLGLHKVVTAHLNCNIVACTLTEVEVVVIGCCHTVSAVTVVVNTANTKTSKSIVNCVAHTLTVHKTVGAAECILKH